MPNKLTQTEKAKAALDAANKAKENPKELTAAEKETARLAKAKENEAKKAIEKAKADKKEADANKPKLKKGEFLNPFDKGVAYKDFLKSIPTGISIEKHCEKKLSKDQIVWLVSDVKLYKKK
jgi:hypothetical protein